MTGLMTIAFVLFVIFIGFVVVLFFYAMYLRVKIAWRLLQGNERVSEKVEYEVTGYKARDRVMNDSESALFHNLVKALPEDHYIFPKMRIADILATLGGNGYIHRRNKILPKHIDFLVCDKYFQPLLAIELDGSSHEAEDRVERDILVNKIFASTDLKLHRVKVGADFQSVGVEISSLIKA